MHSIPIPRGLLPSRARYASECEGKNTKYFLSDQMVIRNISLQFDYYALFLTGLLPAEAQRFIKLRNKDTKLF